MENYVTDDIQVVNEGTTYPFIVCDNWYSPNEEKAVWSELNFYSHQKDMKTIERAENTIVAKSTKGEPLSNAYRFYFDEYYTGKYVDKTSFINKFQYKLRQKKLHDYIAKCKPYHRSYLSTTSTSSLISYYEQDDSYLPHHDTFAWTILIWFCKEPKLFKGGDFDFPESKTQVNFKHNRAVFFPCCYNHRVSPVKFIKKPKEFGYGRWTITHFLYTIPIGNPSDKNERS